MPKKQCSSCRFVGAATEGEVTFSRSGTSRRYLTQMCLTCWLTLALLVEEQSVGFVESLPFMNGTAKRALRTAKSRKESNKP